MRNKKYIIYYYFALLNFLLNIPRCYSQSNKKGVNEVKENSIVKEAIINEKLTKFVLDTYDTNGEFIKRYNLTYNYSTYTFNKYKEIRSINNVNIVFICHEEDIEKSEDEREVLFLWSKGSSTSFSEDARRLNSFPIFYYDMKKKNKTFCFKIQCVGWDNNVLQPICDDHNSAIPCPDLITLGTTQLSYRYNKGESISLNNYFSQYFKKTGISIESILNKYSYYDYRIDNN